MITQNYCEVSPAYGRDYKSGKDAKEDFFAGKDFKMKTLMSSGTYCSVRDFAPGTKVLVRYKKLTQVVNVTVP